MAGRCHQSPDAAAGAPYAAQSGLDNAKIRVLTVGNEEQPHARKNLEEMLADIRIDADVILLENFDSATLVHAGQDATLVMVPFRLIDKRVSTVCGGAIEDILHDLPVTALVLAAEDIDLEAEPEEGEAVEAAHMVDASDDAARKAQDARKAADSARTDADKKNAALEQAKGKSLEEEKINELTRSVQQAEEAAVQAERKAAKAGAKADLAAREAENPALNETNGVSKTEKASNETQKKDMV